MRAAALALAGLLVTALPAAADTVLLHAAGSLRAPFTELIRAWEARGGTEVTAVFGPSGTLLGCMVGGEQAAVFASANMGHPLTLSRAGRSGAVTAFARNRLCALARPGLHAETDTVVALMLDPAVKLGTSTPGADPAGDYAWEVFRKVDALRPGSFAALNAKALRLTGGPASTPPPNGRNPYAAIIKAGNADLFLTYCTNARQAADAVPGARVVELPEAVAVGAEYGLTVLNGASPGAHELARFILSPDGQAILARHGFSAPDVPAGGT